MGFIDKTGKEVISFMYDGLGNFVNGFALVMFNGKYGYIDNTGNEAVPAMCQSIEEAYKEINNR